jgi:phenylacetate-coenzyme A ligase PaaK-like adenylate-forming protein
MSGGTSAPDAAARPLPCRHIDPDTQRQLSFERLQRFLERDVLAYSPYYRRVFADAGLDAASIRTIADLARVPFTTKDDFRDHGPQFVLQPRWPGRSAEHDTEVIGQAYLDRYEAKVKSRVEDDVEPPQSAGDLLYREFLLDWQPVLETRTGGTTGRSAHAAYTYSDLLGPFARAARFHHNIPSWTPTQRFMSLLPAGEHLGFYGNMLVPLLNGQPIRPMFGGRVTSTENQVLAAAAGKVQVIQATSSYLASWLDTACAMMRAGKIAGLPSVQLATAGGEPLTDGYAQSIRRSLAELGAAEARLIHAMSSTELKSGAFRECDPGTGLHVDPQHYFIELLDPETREPVPEGRPGVLVWSHIDWHGSVILRYWSGDLVEGGVRRGPCPVCGLVVPRLMTPLRRLETDFLKIRGARVDLTDLRSVLEDLFGRDGFQLEVLSDAGGIGRHRIVVYGRHGKVDGPDVVREAVRGAVELGVD